MSQTKIFEWKTTITKIKDLLNVPQNWLELTEESTNLKTDHKIIQYEENRKKRRKIISEMRNTFNV